MGTFDRLACEMYVPERPEYNEFQTKDLGCGMEFFKISKDGLLWKQKRDKQGRLTEEFERSRHTGVVNFYGNAEQDPRSTCAGDWRYRPEPDWIEYKVEFKNGLVVSSIVPSYESQSVARRAHETMIKFRLVTLLNNPPLERTPEQLYRWEGRICELVFFLTGVELEFGFTTNTKVIFETLNWHHEKVEVDGSAAWDFDENRKAGDVQP